ncbi:hypothetical protein A1O3_09173 [Capronia epimyces CBS 606.96]|uniref:Uncharacterized protein n=1 Tax=Capronia epimyces CBS 606.96 TaxID=1182542 RepID=W9Y6G7_9EURO|nr:uncharacterized protein A1O3_09173 [Capronia epimyces CBS 606.96]EXJ78014.1 hypothetical protein A1O3_09173 [Capronia epimyces CBS 606.96]
MERPGTEQTLAWPPAEDNDFHSLRRKYRSMENVADPAREIATARSRLRSVIDKNVTIEKPKRDRVDTLAELGHMLDDAIEDQSLMPGVISAEMSDEATPRPDLTSYSQTSQPVCHHSHSRGPEVRQSMGSAMPRSSEEFARVNNAEKSRHRQPPLRKKSHDDKHGTETPLVETRPRTSPERQLSCSVLEPGSQALTRPDEKLSPVKQRAALFESLVQKPSEHEQICQHFPPGRGAPQGGSHNRKETKRFARIKFGGTIEERPATPLIPLTLPTIVSTEQNSSTDSSVMTVEQPAPEHAASVDDRATEAVPHQRTASMNWPFKWTIFSKPPSTPPQEARPLLTGDEAKDVHHPGSKPSAVKSIVQDLLQAANGKDDAENRRRHSEKERLSRRQSRPPPVVKESELGEGKVDLEDLKPANVPPLQMPITEEVEGLGPFPKVNDTLSEPRTPLQRAMTEKQVLSPPNRFEALSESSPSPRKPDPRTPVRGRSTRSTHRLSVGEHRGVEQRFNLSPGSSRSTSRNGRAGIKVEVEVRDSPEREARDKGEKIVIIRANVESVDNE